ncbi:MAG: hypothetical protein AAGI37_17920 [Planctomycetota bacterium]
MADLSQTAANVGVNDSNTRTQIVQAGEAITQGEPVYLNNGKYFLGDASALASSQVTGIALTPAVTDGYFIMATSGKVDLGDTLTVGETYYVSDTPGNIMPAGDISTGEYVTSLGVASAADTLELNINASGIARA